MIQMHAFYVFLAVAGLLVMIFIYVAFSTRRARDIDYHAAYSLRQKFFFVLLVVLLFGLGMTLGKTPYPKANDLPDKVVFVVGKQPEDFAGRDVETDVIEGRDRPPPQVRKTFRQALDVNHGFGVYSPDGRLIAQTQAMPGYVNRLRVRFTQPGRYNVLCLELCGMGHHRMRGVFEVK